MAKFLPYITKFWDTKRKKFMREYPDRVWNQPEQDGIPSFSTKIKDTSGFPLHHLLYNPFDIDLTKPITPAIVRKFREHFGLRVDAHDYGLDPILDRMGVKAYERMLQFLIDDNVATKAK